MSATPPNDPKIVHDIDERIIAQKKALLMERIRDLNVQDKLDVKEVDALIVEAFAMKKHFDFDEALQVLAIKPGDKKLAEELLSSCQPILDTEKNQKMNFGLTLAVQANLEIGDVDLAKTIVKLCGEKFEVGLPLKAIVNLGNIRLVRFIEQEFGDWDIYNDRFGNSQLKFLPLKIRGISKIASESIDQRDKKAKQDQGQDHDKGDMKEIEEARSRWTDQDEKSFQELLRVLKIDPERYIKNHEILLIQKLIRSYIFASLKPYAEVPYYQKLTEVFNIFLDNFLEVNADVLGNSDSLRSVEKNAVFQMYPVLNSLSQYLSNCISDLQSKTKSSHKKFLDQPIAKMLDKAHLSSLDPMEDESAEMRFEYTNHPYPHPFPQSNEASMLSYHDMALHLLEGIRKPSKKETLHEPKGNEELGDLISCFYHVRRAKGIYSLMQMYTELSLYPIRNVPHVCYSTTTDYFLLNPTLPRHHIFPHEKFKRIASLQFKYQLTYGTQYAKKPLSILSSLLGRALCEDNAFFRGFSIRNKIFGRDPGFILDNGKERFFGKYTSNAVPDYFCGRVMSELGVKMAESFLNIDSYGNCFLITRDLSRQYSNKKHHIKTKSFSDLGHLLITTAPEAAFAREKKPDHPPFKEQQESLNAFLDGTMHSKTARVSFVKIWLLQIVCSLKDVFAHGGNVGVIKTQTKEKQYCKFGLVDYDCVPQEVFSVNSFGKFDKNRLFLSMPSLPVFKEICQRITDEDIFEACKTLISPKVRSYSGERGDLLLVQFPRSHTASDHVIDKVYDEVTKELHRSQLPEDEKEKTIKELGQLKDIFKDNLKSVTIQLMEELGPKLKDRKDQPLETAESSGLSDLESGELHGETEGVFNALKSTLFSAVKRFF